MTIIACLDTFVATRLYMVMTMPNQSIEDAGDCDTSQNAKDYANAPPWSQNDTWGYSAAMANVSTATVVVTVFCVSFATRAKYAAASRFLL